MEMGGGAFDQTLRERAQPPVRVICHPEGTLGQQEEVEIGNVGARIELANLRVNDVVERQKKDRVSVCEAKKAGYACARAGRASRPNHRIRS